MLAKDDLKERGSISPTLLLPLAEQSSEEACRVVLHDVRNDATAGAADMVPRDGPAAQTLVEAPRAAKRRARVIPEQLYVRRREPAR
jgi:hypothetical protein